MQNVCLIAYKRIGIHASEWAKKYFNRWLNRKLSKEFDYPKFLSWQRPIRSSFLLFPPWNESMRIGIALLFLMELSKKQNNKKRSAFLSLIVHYKTQCVSFFLVLLCSVLEPFVLKWVDLQMLSLFRIKRLLLLRPLVSSPVDNDTRRRQDHIILAKIGVRLNIYRTKSCRHGMYVNAPVFWQLFLPLVSSRGTCSGRRRCWRPALRPSCPLSEK
jgi:hypothetical protein